MAISHYSIAQKTDNDPQKTYIIEQRIQVLAEMLEEEELDYTTMFDELNNFYDNPINLNNTNLEELKQLRLLTDIQINNLLEHIKRNGKLMSIYELQAVEGFDLELIYMILPFVKVTTDINSPKISFSEMMKNGQNAVYIRYIRVLEDQEGFLPIEDSVLASSPNKRYLGSKDKLYMRYRFKFRQNMSWGYTAEKDAGEEFFRGSQKQGFDFYSAHFFMKGYGKLKALAIGDYHAQFGQGLTFWSGLGFGKSSYVMNISKNAPGLKPYTSVDENNFMRGAGATVKLGNIELTGFASHKKIDANITQTDTINSSDAEQISFTSFQQTGLHTTPGEIADKDAITETNFGGHLAYKKRTLNIGLTGVYSNYSGNLTRNLATYNQFEFNSNSLLALGVDYNYIYKNYNFFGEFSRTDNGGLAYINGVLIALDPKLSMSILHRNYARDYQQLRSLGFAESSKNVNENGLFIGLEGKISKQFTLTAYFDRFKFPWLRFGVDAPSSGFDVLGQATYKPSKKLLMYFRARYREKPKNTNLDIEDIDFITSTNQTNYRYNVTYKVSESVKLRNRVEVVEYQFGTNDKEYGFMVYQDVMYKALSSPISLTFRYALFDTDSYNSRIYSYENDVLYYFSIPAYYYRGSRTYLTLRYTIKKGVDVWLRWAQWYYSNRSTINSGLNEIQGNTKTEVKIQFRLKF